MTTTLHVLQHALGRDEYGRPNPTNPDYRNYYVSGEGCDGWDILLQAVADGLMIRRKGNEISGGNDVFCVTEAGKDYIAENSPKPPPEPKLTRAQKRYKQWLESDFGLTFAEYNGWRSREQKRRDAEDDAWRKKFGLPQRDRRRCA